MSRKSRPTEMENTVVVAWGWGVRVWLTVNRYTGTFWDNGNVLKLDSVDGCTIL